MSLISGNVRHRTDDFLERILTYVRRIENSPTPLSRERLGSIGTTTNQTLTPPAGAVGAAIQPYGQAVWYTVTGDNPSATVGLAASVGDIIYVGMTPNHSGSTKELNNFVVNSQTGTASIEVLYFVINP